ncbi:hypothetical protein DQ04_19441000 [Trypanosoma grayi]|uniref:hypothetical protein n=1 Tax=Trypanosoma grayi TaxID=71804 RepID=UPI0004F3FABD|nr:hypothetical protein DQ04_19441000 [Trypanosoma grayi]KEG05675.1 hypothetical protein DQ04_19441000 [Trypanosoma grayi]
MELPVKLLLEGAPKRQRYFRVAHILFGDGGGCGGEWLHASACEELLVAAAGYLKEGLSVRDVHKFRRWCKENPHWCLEECLVSTQDEDDVGTRADLAMQHALSALDRSRGEDIGSASNQSSPLTAKRSRLEAVELHELREQLRVAEVFADMHDHGAMSKTLNRLLVSVQSMYQTTLNSHKVEFFFVQLEIIRRSVELFLSSGDLNAVRGLVGASTTTLIENAAQCLLSAQGGNSSHVALQQRCSEEMMSELEECVLFFSMVRALGMFEDRDFKGFANVFTANGLRGAKWAPIAEELITKRGTSQVAASLGARVNSPGALPAIRNLRRFVGEFITSGTQLGVMLLFCAVAALPRMEALELVSRVDVMQLWEDVPGAHMILQALRQARFADALRSASVLATMMLKTDLFAYKHSELLLLQMKQSIIAGYTSSFARLDLRKTAMRLSISLEELHQILRKLIIDGRLAAKMDLVAHVLLRTEPNEDTREYSTPCSVLLDCIHRNDRCAADLEQSLRLLSLHRHRAW